MDSKENKKEEFLRNGWGRVIKRSKEGYFYSVVERDLKSKGDLEKLRIGAHSIGSDIAVKTYDYYQHLVKTFGRYR